MDNKNVITKFTLKKSCIKKCVHDLTFLSDLASSEYIKHFLQELQLQKEDSFEKTASKNRIQTSNHKIIDKIYG